MVKNLHPTFVIERCVRCKDLRLITKEKYDTKRGSSSLIWDAAHCGGMQIGWVSDRVARTIRPLKNFNFESLIL